jgi:hypothetical protein
MPVYITYFIQILLVIHVLKTGKNRYWIYLLLFVPMVGGVAYLVIEILPEFRGSIQGQRAMRSVRNTVNPEAELAKHAAAWEQSTNTDNARRYANALLNHGQYSQAKAILEEALSGFFSSEPTLLLLKAKIAFETGNIEEAAETLEYLQKENPDFRSAQGHLIYARALEATQRMDEAIDEYQSVSNYFPGAEARYRLAKAYATSDQNEKAREEFEGIINDASLAPPHFKKSQKKWLAKANEQLKLLLMEHP